MKITHSFLILLIEALVCCAGHTATGQSKHKGKPAAISPFTATIWDSDYSMAYSLVTILTEQRLELVFKSGLQGEKDSVLFSRRLIPSDTLRQISLMNLDSLKTNYRNPCIHDGSQIMVILRKNGKEKAVHLSNFYQKDIGKIIGLVNAMIPEQYKIWYNKEDLLRNQEECQQQE